MTPAAMLAEIRRRGAIAYRKGDTIRLRPASVLPPELNVRKTRPRRGDPIAPGASERDIAAAVGLSRRRIWEAKQAASIPEDEFEALIESDDPPSITALVNVARRRAGLTVPARSRRCPHCGGALEVGATIRVTADGNGDA